MIFFLIIIAAIVVVLIINGNNNKKLKEAEQQYIEKYKQALIRGDEQIQIDYPEIKLNYKLPIAKANQLSLNARRACMNHAIQTLSEHGTLSPENCNEILGVGNRLQLNKQSCPDILSNMEKMVKYWKIEHEPLPPQSVNINLQKDEICYYQGSAGWHENRTVTKSVHYSGYSTSIKIAKGVRYRVGSVKSHRVTQNTLVLIDSGTLYITSKRIVFTGQKKNSNIKFSSILSVVPYSDAIGIQKDSGKSPIISCSDPDIAGRILIKTISPMDMSYDELVTDEFQDEIKRLIASNRKLEAVKLVKDQKGYSLVQAKEYVDSL